LRSFHLIVADDAVLYTPIHVDSCGCALPLTKSSFTITDARDGTGSHMVDIFLEAWESAKPV
jgi:hypothetical protein